MVGNDYELPTKIVECFKLYKPEDKLDEADMKKGTLNARAMNSFVYVLSPERYIRVSNCEIAKESRDTLEFELMKSKRHILLISMNC